MDAVQRPDPDPSWRSRSRRPTSTCGWRPCGWRRAGCNGALTAADEFPQFNGNASYTREKISNQGVIGIARGGSSSSSAHRRFATAWAARQERHPDQSLRAGGGIAAFNLFQYRLRLRRGRSISGAASAASVESADANIAARFGRDPAQHAMVMALSELARDYIQLRGQQRDLQIAKRHPGQRAAEPDASPRSASAGGLTTGLDVANAVRPGWRPPPRRSRSWRQHGRDHHQRDQPLAWARRRVRFGPSWRGRRRCRRCHPRCRSACRPNWPERRPDIRQAEAQVARRDRRRSAQAEADFFPKVTLSGSVGLQALQFKDLGNWNVRRAAVLIGPSITLPIFEGGRLKYTLDLRKAQEQEAAVTYQQTVLQAFHDVDNALTAYAAEQQRRAALAKRGGPGAARARPGAGAVYAGFVDVPGRADGAAHLVFGAAAIRGQHDDRVDELGAALQGARRRVGECVPPRREGGEGAAFVQGLSMGRVRISVTQR